MVREAEGEGKPQGDPPPFPTTEIQGELVFWSAGGST